MYFLYIVTNLYLIPAAMIVTGTPLYYTPSKRTLQAVLGNR